MDLEATDDRSHGNQEERFFYGDYDFFCYLALYMFAGDVLLAANLRRSNIDASAGAPAELERIITRIRARIPEAPIIVRAASGFRRGHVIMSRCEANGVRYLFGMARNSRLQCVFQATEHGKAAMG